jgi:hypothetical protein
MGFSEAIIKPQHPPAYFPVREFLHRLGGTRNISKVSMSETARLASSAINCDTNINDILDLGKEIVEISIRHLKGHVPDEQRFARGVGRPTLVCC